MNRWEHGLEIPNPAWSLPVASQQELANLISRWKLVGDELNLTSDKFGGDHWSSSNHAEFVRWAPNNGFIRIQTYEGIDVVDFSYGSVTVTPAEVIFSVEREVRSSFFGTKLRATPKRWVAALWKDVKYLVEADDIPNFGMYVAGLGKYNEFNGPAVNLHLFYCLSGNQQVSTPTVRSSRANPGII